jgi:hypothetical protein
MSRSVELLTQLLKVGNVESNFSVKIALVDIVPDPEGVAENSKGPAVLGHVIGREVPPILFAGLYGPPMSLDRLHPLIRIYEK